MCFVSDKAKGRYTCCDLVAYDLVTLYGINSSSILYDMSYATYDLCNFVIHLLRFIDRMQPSCILGLRGHKLLLTLMAYAN